MFAQNDDSNKFVLSFSYIPVKGYSVLKWYKITKEREQEEEKKNG